MASASSPVFSSSPPVQFSWRPSIPPTPSYSPVSNHLVPSSRSQPNVILPLPVVSPVDAPHPSPVPAPAALPAISVPSPPAEAPHSSQSVPSLPPSSPPSSITLLSPTSMPSPGMELFIPAISPLLPLAQPEPSIDSPPTSYFPPLSTPNLSLNSHIPSPPSTSSISTSQPSSPSFKLPPNSSAPSQSTHPSSPSESPLSNPSPSLSSHRPSPPPTFSTANSQPLSPYPMLPTNSSMPHAHTVPNSPENTPEVFQLSPIASPAPAVPPPISSKTPSIIVQGVSPPLSAPPSSSLHPKPLPAIDISTTNRSRQSSGNGVNKTALTSTLSAAAGLLVVLFVAIIWVLKKKRHNSANSAGNTLPPPLGSSAKSDTPVVNATDSSAVVRNDSIIDFTYIPPDPGGLGNSRSLFAYEELWRVTNGFSDKNFLGKGGFGSVYKGCLQDGREVAIKNLKFGGGQGEREFKAEVEIISRVHHRHLVTLAGYCISESKRLLIYDYVPNNNLHFHLHEKDVPDMDWATRMKIASGAARGIAYLHEDCNPRIIHRDIKSSNILLDDNFDAQVSDFGLAKLAIDANTHVSTRVVGTFGYMAPEYALSGKLTEKSDVFSFGVVILELITGRKPVDSSQPSGDESLVEWARPLLICALENKELDKLVDPRLGNDYVQSEMLRMIEVAAACVRHLAGRRPQMGQVVRAIENITSSDLTNGLRIGESEVHDSALQSAEIRLMQRMAFGNQTYTIDFL